MSTKNPLTSAEIEPTTFRFVAQHLNHCATAGPFCNSDRALLLQSNRTLKGSLLQQFSRKSRTLFLHQAVPILLQTAETEHGMSFTSSNVHETCPFINTPWESLQPTVGMRPVPKQYLLIDLYNT